MSNEYRSTPLEWETAIPHKEAKVLLQLGLDKTIEKIRYIIPCYELSFEVDEFLSPNNNLILNEIELPSENTPFSKTPMGGQRRNRRPFLFQYNDVMP